MRRLAVNDPGKGCGIAASRLLGPCIVTLFQNNLFALCRCWQSQQQAGFMDCFAPQLAGGQVRWLSCKDC